MTPEQKELKKLALAGKLADPNVKVQLTIVQHPDNWVEEQPDASDWLSDKILIRLVPPVEIPESEEARARRLLEKFGIPHYMPQNSEWRLRPKGWSGFPGKWFAVFRNGQWHTHSISIGATGKRDLFYAELVVLSEQTDQEKAEAALNAYKLEPGERLVMRGERWRSKCITTYLTYDSSDGWVARTNRNYAHGSLGCYYAEIIKEPELVPWDFTSCPPDGYFRDNRYADSSRKMVMVGIVQRGVLMAAHEISVEPTYFVTWRELFEHYEFSEAIGTTWTRAGKIGGAL